MDGPGADQPPGPGAHRQQGAGQAHPQQVAVGRAATEEQAAAPAPQRRDRPLVAGRERTGRTAHEEPQPPVEAAVRAEREHRRVAEGVQVLHDDEARPAREALQPAPEGGGVVGGHLPTGARAARCPRGRAHHAERGRPERGGVGGEVADGGPPPAPGQTGDQQATPVGQVDAEDGPLVPARPHRKPRQLTCGAGVVPGGRAPASRVPGGRAPGGRAPGVGRLPGQRQHRRRGQLRHVEGVRVAAAPAGLRQRPGQRQLALQALLAQQRSSGRAVPRHGPCGDPGEHVVGPVGQRQQQPGADRGRQPAPGYEPVTGEQAGEAGGRPLPDQPGQGRGTATGIPVVELGAERLDTVHEQQQRRARPVRVRSPRGDLLPQPLHQPHGAVHLPAAHHGARVREAGGVPGQPATAVVEHVHVQLLGGPGGDRLGQDRAQPRGAAAAGTADGQPAAAAVRVELQRVLGLGRRVVHQPDPQRASSPGRLPERQGGQVVGLHAVGQRRAPGTVRWGEALLPRPAGQRGHRPCQVGRPSGLFRGGRRGAVRPPPRGHPDGAPRGGRVAGDPRDLHQLGGRATHPHQRPAGDVGGQPRRGGQAEHVPGLGLVGGAQADAQGAVGPDLGGDHAGRALGRQDEVDAQGAAALGDADQAREEVGLVLGQAGELVDHDHQPGGVDVGRERGEVRDPVPGQQPLAPGQLGTQRPQGPGGPRRVEVGDHPDGVREPCRLGERGATLVVDQEEGAPVRRVGQGEPQDERLQELGLPGAGGPRDERVGPVPAQVERERAGGGAAEREHQRPAVARPRPPGAPPGHGRHARPGQVEQADPPGQTPTHPGRLQGGEPPGDLAGDRRREPVDGDAGPVGGVGHREQPRGPRLALQPQPGAGDHRWLPARTRPGEGEDPPRPGLAQGRAGAGAQRAVDHDDRPADLPGGAGAGAAQGGHPGQGGVLAGGGVDGPRRQVGEPAQPRPRVQPGALDQQRQTELPGREQDGELGDQRGDHPGRHGFRAAHPQAPGGREVHGHGPAGRGGGPPLSVGLHEGDPRRPGGAPDPDHDGVGVLRGALPQRGCAPADGTADHGEVGVLPLGRAVVVRDGRRDAVLGLLQGRRVRAGGAASGPPPRRPVGQPGAHPDERAEQAEQQEDG
nr:hypothetical protein [Geodermatophilus sp. LHW52908]